MSEIIDSPPGPLQYSGPVGKVWGVNGHPITSRRSAPHEDAWQGLEYTSVYRPDDMGRSAGRLEYTAPHPGVTYTRPAKVHGAGPLPISERRPAHSGEPAAPYVSRLAGLPPRTTFDWSGIVTGCATVYDTPLVDHHGEPEVFYPTSFARDHGVEIPILLLHDYDRHVGWATLEHRARHGLYFTGQLNRDGAKRIGNWRGLSLGFIALANLTPRRRRQHFTCQALEVSVCDRGCHHPHSYIRMAGEAAPALAA